MRLDEPLPVRLIRGSASALFVAGTASHAGAAITGLALVVDGASHRPIAFGMPRPDEPGGGFWGIVPVVATAERSSVAIGVSALLGDGSRVEADLGSIPIVAPEEPLEVPAPPGAGELIAVCMATYEPDETLFARQVDSLREQTDGDWICVISDDRSSSDSFEAIERIAGDDPRFLISRSPERLGFYRNFERALSLAPAAAPLLALCDQDDRWHPDKLASLRGALGGSVLAFSDLRLVDAEGRVLRESIWNGRRNNRSSLASMVMANTVVGASMLIRREVVAEALPFPDAPGWEFHDGWLSAVALARGGIAYVDRPLYDYVQHRAALVAQVGVEEAGGPRSRIRLGRPDFHRWRAIYFRNCMQTAVLARTLLLRGGERLTRRDRRALARLADPASPSALAWLAARPARELIGRNETLGTEWHLLKGAAWYRLARLIGRRRKLDTAPPPLDINEIGQPRLKRWMSGG